MLSIDFVKKNNVFNLFLWFSFYWFIGVNISVFWYIPI